MSHHVAGKVHTVGYDWVTFGDPPPDHVAPELLDDIALDECVIALRAKLRSAHVELFEAHLRGALFSALVLIGTLVLLWIGPATFVETLDGRGIATAWDVIFWWIILAPVAAVGGGYGVISLGRRLREVRGWHHRTTDLRHRLEAACAEQHRRTAPDSPPGAPS